jgi:hypothetical protein
MDPNPEVHTVMTALARYLSDNPLACDAPDGIGRWWLQGRHAVAVVEQALEALRVQGVVERWPAADGRVRWRIAGLTPTAPAAGPLQ